MKVIGTGLWRLTAQTMLVATCVLATDAGFAQTAGRVTRESVDSLGAQVFGESGGAALSADGRLVAFHSDAADLVPGDTNLDTDVVRPRPADRRRAAREPHLERHGSA